MHLHTPEDLPDTPTQRAADRRQLLRALNFSLSFVLMLAAAFALQQGEDYRALTVTAMSMQGLWGLLTAPLLHGSVGHLAANSLSVLILGTLAGTVFPKATMRALPLVWLGSGLGTWLIADGGYHLGASGVTHGLGFLVFTLGIVRRDRPAIAAALIAFFFFGGMLVAIFPTEVGVSWQYHLSGAVFGLLAGLLWRRADPAPPRKRYSWELEEEEAGLEDDPTLEPPRPDDVPVLWQRTPEERGVVLPFRQPPLDQ